MALDPLLDVIELEAEMPAESVVGDRIVVTARCASIDERLGDTDDLCDLLDVEIARREEELELLRLCRLVIVRHDRYLDAGKLHMEGSARLGQFRVFAANEFVVNDHATTRSDANCVAKGDTKGSQKRRLQDLNSVDFSKL